MEKQIKCNCGKLLAKIDENGQIKVFCKKCKKEVALEIEIKPKKVRGKMDILQKLKKNNGNSCVRCKGHKGVLRSLKAKPVFAKQQEPGGYINVLQGFLFDIEIYVGDGNVLHVENLKEEEIEILN